MTHLKFYRAFVFLGVMTVSTAGVCADTSAKPLEGVWGGDRLQLVVDAKGGRVELDCASGAFAGPIMLSAAGTFTVVGTFDEHQPGPQRADESPASPARFSGDVGGDEMRLSIAPHGPHQTQVFSLRKGVRVKLIRCL